MDSERGVHAQIQHCLKLLNGKKEPNIFWKNVLLVDHDKVFCSTQRQTLYDILKSRNIPGTLLKAREDTYIKNKILIKVTSKLSRLALRQGCPVSPSLCNMYLHETLTKWQKEEVKGISLSKTQQQIYLMIQNFTLITN
jgi:hypothetical protein